MTCHLCATSWTTRPCLLLDQLLSPFKRAHPVEGASPGSSLLCLKGLASLFTAASMDHFPSPLLIVVSRV